MEVKAPIRYGDRRARAAGAVSRDPRVPVRLTGVRFIENQASDQTSYWWFDFDQKPGTITVGGHDWPFVFGLHGAGIDPEGLGVKVGGAWHWGVQGSTNYNNNSINVWLDFMAADSVVYAAKFDPANGFVLSDDAANLPASPGYLLFAQSATVKCLANITKAWMEFTDLGGNSWKAELVVSFPRQWSDGTVDAPAVAALDGAAPANDTATFENNANGYPNRQARFIWNGLAAPSGGLPPAFTWANVVFSTMVVAPHILGDVPDHSLLLDAASQWVYCIPDAVVFTVGAATEAGFAPVNLLFVNPANTKGITWELVGVESYDDTALAGYSPPANGLSPNWHYIITATSYNGPFLGVPLALDAWTLPEIPFNLSINPAPPSPDVDVTVSWDDPGDVTWEYKYWEDGMVEPAGWTAVAVPTFVAGGCTVGDYYHTRVRAVGATSGLTGLDQAGSIQL